MSTEPDTNTTGNMTRLKLYQLNINKSLLTHSGLLHQIKTDDDIIMIQEPYISKQGKSRAMQGWITVYPSNHEEDPSHTRALTLINRSISTNAWSSIPLATQDAIVIIVQTPMELLIVVNIYSDGDSTET